MNCRWNGNSGTWKPGVCQRCWRAARRWSGNNFIQAEFKINLSKNTETACWKSKWQIVWIFMNFLSSQLYHAMGGLSKLQECFVVQWKSGCSFLQVKPAPHCWLISLCALLKYWVVYGPEKRLHFLSPLPIQLWLQSEAQLSREKMFSKWIHHKHSPCPVMVGIGE